MRSSTGREKREIVKSGWSSKNKVESGEYILRQPPKKPIREEADNVDTTTTASWASGTTLEYTTQASTNM